MRRIGIVIYIVLGVSLSGLFAQQADSLFKLYKEAQFLEPALHRDTMSIERYAAYAKKQLNNGHQDAEAIVDTLYQLTSASAWPRGGGIYLHVKGFFHDREGNMDEALKYYNLAIDSLRVVAPYSKDLAIALRGAGFVLLNTGLYEESLETLQEGYAVAKLAKDVNSQWVTLNFFGDYYYYSAFGQEQFDSALHYYLKTDTLMKVHKLGSYYQSDNDLGLANVYRRLGKDSLSEWHFNRSLKLAEEAENYGVIYALYVDKAEVVEKEGKLLDGLKLKLEAYEYVQKSGWIEFIARADRHLYDSYKSLEDYESALFYYEKYNRAQDSMRKDQAAARYQELEAKYESERKEQQIIQLENDQLEQWRNFLLILSVLAALLVGVVVWNNRKLSKANRILEKKNKEIMVAQLKGQNLERRRMATELHDNLNTKIAAIRWQLEAIAPSADGKVQKILQKTLDLVNDVYGDVRLISHNLMPEKVEALGLIQALENLIGQLKQNNKVKFNLVVNTKPDFDFGSLTYPLYNIIFEMINNILKHAEAKNGWISISEENRSILVTVSDDGKGFDIDQMHNGYGIRNITSRLENIRGKWNIESSPGRGTQFFMEIPKIS
ncbi:MAG: ATP-binding protein [Bacteroidota bacterium]